MTRLRSITSIAAVLAGLAIPTVGVAGAASATPGDWEPFHNEFSAVEEDACGVSGLTLEHVLVSDGRERFTVHGPDGLSYHAQFEEVSHTVTNVATGESVTQVFDLRYADLSVTDNGDGTSTIVTQRPATVVYIQDGQVISRSASLVRFEALIDNGGTPTDPSDDEFLDEVVIKDVGNRPNFCATIVQAIG
jgi:hypothetical protein